MNKRNISFKVLASLFALGAVSMLAGCTVAVRPVRSRVVVERPAPARVIVYR